jgi:hypothetical protein
MRKTYRVNILMAYRQGYDAVMATVVNSMPIVDAYERIAKFPHDIRWTTPNPYGRQSDNLSSIDAALWYAFDAGVNRAVGLRQQAYRGLRNARRTMNWLAGENA